MSSPNPRKPDRDPSQQNSGLLEAEQDEEEHEEAGEAERREREFPARPGEECSAAFHCYSHHIKNNLRFCPMIFVSVQLEVVFLFLDRSPVACERFTAIWLLGSEPLRLGHRQCPGVLLRHGQAACEQC